MHNLLKNERKPINGKQRDSNFELYRVITMFLIVMHHYVVNSGLLAADGPVFSNALSVKSMGLLLAGAWGKIGINCFVLITGYFMCKSKITLKKYIKLLLTVMFYNIVINCVFWVTGYAPFNLLGLVKAFLPVQNIGSGFTSAYLVFFLLIPFLNILIANMKEKQHIYLLILFGFLYVFLETVPLFSVKMNYVSWFAVLYALAAYLRIYPKPLFENRRFWTWATIMTVAVSACSVVACSILGARMQKNIAYYFVTDANTLLAVCVALSSFLLVKNVKIPYSRLINDLGATTFGILLIHANSDTMRQWLWVDLLDCVGAYAKSWLPLHVIGSCLLIFAVCAAIEHLRLRLIEAPLFAFWDRYEKKSILAFQKLEDKICKHLHIAQDSSEQEET